MTATELSDYLKAANAKPLLLDVREPWEYQVARIAGSVLIPMQQVPGRIGELDKTRETVVICHYGIRSRQVGKFLENQGFDGIVNLTGGIDAWAQNVEPSLPRY